MIANQQQQQHQTSRQFDYLRLLAKLADCPASGAKVTSIMATAPTTATTGQTNNSTSQLISNPNNLQADEMSTMSGAQTTTTTTTTTSFECLRQKPIEQIMQRIPLELLQSSPGQQQPGKWQRAINLLFSTGLTPMTATSTGPPANLDNLNEQQLELLINLSTREQLQRSIKPNEATTSSGTTSHLDASELAELDALFNAIYTQQGPTMRPLFGPHLGPTIIEHAHQQQDLAAAMLGAELDSDQRRSESLFGGRDLLIGVTHQLVDRGPSSTETRTEDDSDGHRLGPGHLLAEYFNAQAESNGLDEEQAIGQVNSFVKSFYRYHQQEISNSIVEHYLTGTWRAPKRVGLVTTPTEKPNQPEEQRKQQHQVFLFDSLLEAFQDALVNVPVLKTAIIHSVRQLESVADVFVGQLYERMLNKRTNNPRLIDDKSLLAEFVSFASRLFDDPNWPLELKQNNTDELESEPPHIQQPHSTYLYQFDANLLVKSMESLPGQHRGQVFAQIKSNLRELATQMRAQLKHNLGFSCAFDLIELDEYRQSDRPIDRIHRLICSRLGQMLANFVATGNVNKKIATSEAERNATTADDQMSLYESNCLSSQANSDSNQVDVTNSDHHSVNLANYQPQDRSSWCKSQLDELTLNYVKDNLESLDERKLANPWKVFNVFSQQIATLVSATGDRRLPIELDSLMGDNTNGRPAEDENRLLAKSSFWSNFVQALNCSRTQPLMSLFPSSSLALNSTLLNLNLLSNNCQSNQARTVNSLLSSLSMRMKQQLIGRLSAGNSRENEPLAKRMSLAGNLQDEPPPPGTNSTPDNVEEAGDLAKKQQSSNSLNGSLSLLTVDSSDHLNSTGGVTSRVVHSIRQLVRSKHALIGLLTGSLLISFLLVTTAYAIIRYKKHYRCPADKKSPPEHPDKQVDESNNASLAEQREELAIPTGFLPAIQWQAQDVQPEQDKDVQVCASHSSTLNTSTFSAGNNQDQCPIMLPLVATDGTLDDYEEATQLPLLGSTCVHGSIRHQPGCSMFLLSGGQPNDPDGQLDAHRQLSSNNGGGSSSETKTTTEATNSLASNKKRVKISDPLGAARTLGSSAKLLSRDSQQQQLNYCPVHRAPSYQGVQFLDEQVDPFNYYQTTEWPSQASMLIQRPHQQHLAGGSIDLLDQQLINQNQLYHRSNLISNNNNNDPSFNQTMTLARNIHRHN